ncbi:uncharacterized protein QC761_0015860 [Podospora bellae-mahoneyi]|uniref:Uncharacterized protein n=1 Tax=Podospora bellae-mahoneyi TaxID=2093777 RepID=A0ABR0FZL7_9PEZI|nr:hypothetical protein QC761_0015860 [Podospora bellae-mahoneyi]
MEFEKLSAGPDKSCAEPLSRHQACMQHCRKSSNNREVQVSYPIHPLRAAELREQRRAKLKLQ